jgi:hypothetical protein
MVFFVYQQATTHDLDDQGVPIAGTEREEILHRPSRRGDGILRTRQAAFDHLQSLPGRDRSRFSIHEYLGTERVGEPASAADLNLEDYPFILPDQFAVTFEKHHLALHDELTFYHHDLTFRADHAYRVFFNSVPNSAGFAGYSVPVQRKLDGTWRYEFYNRSRKVHYTFPPLAGTLLDAPGIPGTDADVQLERLRVGMGIRTAVELVKDG